MTVWVGFSQTAVPFVRQERHAGETKYPLRKMLRFRFDAHHLVLELPAAVGDVPRLLLQPRRASSAIPLTIIARYANIFERGVPSTIVVVLLLGGIQLITLGIIGEYVGPHLRRGQAPAAVRRRRAHQSSRSRRRRRMRIAGPGGRRRRPRRARTAPHRRPATRVDVYERWPGLGGQAATLDVGRRPPARALLPPPLLAPTATSPTLYDELGMPDELEWRRRARSRTSPTAASGRSSPRWTCCASSRCRRWRASGSAPRCSRSSAARANPAPFERVTARAWIER